MYLRSKLTISLMTLCAVVALHIFASKTFGQSCSCASGTITCTGTITSSDFTAASRAQTVGGTCATPLACISSISPGPYHYRATAFTNTIAGTTCYTVLLTNNSCVQNLVGYAYVTSYNPASGGECANYLANNGVGVAIGSPDSFSFNVTLNQRVIIVVLDRTAGGDCAGGTYTLTISHTPNNTTCPGTPSAADGNISGRIIDSNGVAVSGATINLSGSQSRKTITDANGNYRFANVETNGFYTVTPTRANYTFGPSSRSFSALGQNTEAAFNATSTGNALNPLDTTEYFVRQQYLDFLGREPEEAGFNAWTDTINNCAPDDASCDRVHVSEMFFRSEEFQQRGYFVYRFYSTALGRKPEYAEFAPDMARVSGFRSDEQLETAKTAFANDFVNRPAFAQYATMSNAQYVDALAQTAGVTLSNRQALVNSLEAGTLTRAAALRQIAESGEVYQKYYNQAFVVMEYFGYLHRDPDALYLNWIDVLNQGGDSRHMVSGFVNSNEHRNRFVAAGNCSNPLDTTEYFVRQHYLDFLGREPDEGGFSFWVNNIESRR